MAGPTVTLTFAGDEKALTKSFANVGAASKSMGDQVAATSKSFDNVGRSTDEYVDKADKAEQRTMGFRDTITGLQDTFKGATDSSLPLGERLLTLGAGVGDLASGFANLLIPALSSFGTWLASTTVGTWAITAAQTAWAAITKAVTIATTALNAAMRANPIGIIITIIAALVAAFVILWNKSEGFRNFFIGMWNGIKSAIGVVIDWIKSAFNGLSTFFSNLVTAIGNIFSGIGNAIKNAFKSAINFVIDILNGAIWALNKVIDGINYVPGVEISHIPKIPKLHTGGVVPGMVGTDQLMMLQAGERVVPRGGDGGGATVSFSGNTDTAVATLIMALIRKGQIQIGGA